MLTKQEADRIEQLLTGMAPFVEQSEPLLEAIAKARASLAHATEGMQLPKHLAMARAVMKLPRCLHRMHLMNKDGEQLTPPCGCRLVEPTR